MKTVKDLEMNFMANGHEYVANFNVEFDGADTYIDFSRIEALGSGFIDLHVYRMATIEAINYAQSFKQSGVQNAE